MREMCFGGPVGYAASLRGSPAAIAFQNSAASAARHPSGTATGIASGTSEARSSFRLTLIGGGKQEPDEFGLPVGSGLFEDICKMGLGRADRYTASACGRLAAIPFKNFTGKYRFRRGQVKTAAQIFFSPPAGDIGVRHRDDRNGRSDADPGQVRQRGLGSKRRHHYMERRARAHARHFEFSTRAMIGEEISRAGGHELLQRIRGTTNG
jgi:hypothetical protein